MSTTVYRIAGELRSRQPDIGVVRLHKLLYFAQGHHLATFDHPLFSETISAWDNGPVVGELWHRERTGGLTGPPATPLGEAELNTIGYVVSRYGSLTSRDLINLTHGEEPWLRANHDRPPGTSRPISLASIREYFMADIDDDTIVLDSAEVKAWLGDAERDPNPTQDFDQPDLIAERIREVRGRSA